MSASNHSGTHRHQTLHLWITGLAAALVLACMVYKAATASMTHDESSTFLNLVDLDHVQLWKCYTDPACWTTANNHLLNTQLMRWSSALFGNSALALRLPNLLLLVVYLFCVVGFARDTARSLPAALCCIALLSLNVYVLDFFALARGYGMGLGWMMLSLWSIWRFILTKRQWLLVLSFTAAILAVFSNLTYLAYAATFTASLILYLVIQFVTEKRRIQVPAMLPVAIIGSSVFLGLYFYRPVQILRDLGEFHYGAATLWEAWEVLMRDSLYGIQWLGEHTVRTVSIATLVSLALAVILPWVRRNEGHLRTFGRFLSLLCVTGIVFFLSNHYLNGALYPSGRKAILFIPPIMLLFWFVLAGWVSRQPWGRWIAALICILIVVHTVRAFQPDTFREWWYDSTTRAMVLEVAAKKESAMPVHLAVEWLFHPSTHFYVQTLDLPVTLLPYSKEITPENAAEYYYLHPEQAGVLEPAFVHEQTFNGRWLMWRVGVVDE